VKKTKSIRFYCFSPLVMITTFLIEGFAAGYVLWRYRKDMIAKLIVMTLASLAFFQLAEYMVCENAFFLSSLDWARLGYVAITMLPPLGLHLGSVIAQKKTGMLIKIAYTNAAAFIIFFLFIGNGMQAEKCLGNYVIFTIAPHASLPYGIYYHGWLLTGISLFWRARQQIKNVARKQALTWLVIGYCSFMVPTLIINFVNPETIHGIPSIMCGFAVLFAFSLLFKVAPLMLKKASSEEYSY